ncbi:hypothetical protein B0T22DRAFT_217477 [Podospora appendiculata]|uniref:Uncharacterized protein n=1 Tax=Podospora appendiculata TaxID=314037 RepID=A0AAE0X579_9PEZI|nr:hypothetical protein B0T22DRAFT_217477 [Podospora appendiculata]
MKFVFVPFAVSPPKPFFLLLFLLLFFTSTFCAFSISPFSLFCSSLFYCSRFLLLPPSISVVKSLLAATFTRFAYGSQSSREGASAHMLEKGINQVPFFFFLSE